MFFKKGTSYLNIILIIFSAELIVKWMVKKHDITKPYSQSPGTSFKACLYDRKRGKARIKRSTGSMNFPPRPDMVEHALISKPLSFVCAAHARNTRKAKWRQTILDYQLSVAFRELWIVSSSNTSNKTSTSSSTQTLQSFSFAFSFSIYSSSVSFLDFFPSLFILVPRARVPLDQRSGNAKLRVSRPPNTHAYRSKQLWTKQCRLRNKQMVRVRECLHDAHAQELKRRVRNQF